MWEAEIKSVSVTKGKATSNVEYKDGTSSFTETYITEDRDGLKSLIESRLRKLDRLDVDKPKAETISLNKQAETAKEVYAVNLQKFHKFASAVNLGVTTEDVQEFITLKQWLKDNFSVDYVDLF